MSIRLWLLILLAAAPQEKAPADFTPAPGHWPQWRGPLRDGISEERELVREWPLTGPALLWKAPGLGEGLGSISVAGGLLFAQGNQKDKDVVSAFDGQGRLVWSSELGPASGEKGVMRYATQRSPTVDDGLLFVTTWEGMINCLDSATGRILWRKSYGVDLGGRRPPWAYGDSPVVDGPVVVCIPGGAQGTLAALNKEDGAVVWRSAALKDVVNAAIVPAEIGGIRQYVVLSYEHVAGISAKDGNVLWKVDRAGKVVVVSPPVVHGDLVFVSSGYGIGCNAYRIESKEGKFTAAELYQGRQLQDQHGGVVCIGDHLYGTDDRSVKCVEVGTGKVVWEERSVGKGVVTAADGLLIVRGEKGALALVEATPEAYREKGRFEQPNRTQDYPHTVPVVAGGRLYIRDQDTLFCYDLRGRNYKAAPPVWNLIPRLNAAPKPSLPLAPGKAPDAAYVPTPQDIVEKMLEMAKVAKDDVVYDLGSGDGRIVFTASRNHGCKSVGFENNPGLVWESRNKIKQAKLDELVTIEEKDLFTVDLSPASVITLYLGEPNNAKLLPQLRKLKPGTRILSHQHLLGPAGPGPDQTYKLRSKEDGEEHTIYLWTAPLREGK